MGSSDPGARVVQLRALLAITQKDLATMTGIAQGTISKVERGDVGLTEVNAHRIAAATETPVEFFQTPADELPKEAINYRKSSAVSAKGEKFLKQTLNEINRVAGDLQYAPSGLKHPSLPIAPAAAAITPVTIEEWAQRFREAAGLGPTDPIRNVIRTAERMGIAVASIEPPERDHTILKGHMGLSTMADRPVVGFVVGESGDRQRFTVAHEIGHIVLHTNRSLPIELRESEAHDFGGALLLPESVARQELSESLTLQGYLKLKSRYGISVQAAIMRARKLGLITRDRQRSLMIQLSSRGWRVNEPVKVTNERPLLLWTELASKFGASPYLPAVTAYGVRAHDLQSWIPDRSRKAPAKRVAPPAGDDGATVVSLFDRT
ncbi:ImmA/IrrE family metallo-endopeptidase [Gordonia sp. UBA7599]|uniref:ImmA/IrrE family metallo-endopeptidase n=1 Tax=unclassified Gordonia (in: high G+C Gram-positive bacteria) TaxID=2657482 RepID=UPI000FA1BDD0|nr:ImmA/IrrE family metallo-endopeptidase [Gordonia sp. UBA7599]RUP38612.1 MAG: ImmA/IrrE family metallo-endopeptidase [Gordonia sp. (in: high G+C Gram-positive bacteria)]HNP56218.1 ImmA/IrrE family metallo-endopeptidase [Gordonia sp. (in: high G+C Gram-positive bacteria)]